MAETYDWDEKLIGLVQQYSHIYNPASKDHKNKQMVANSWISIAADMESSAPPLVLTHNQNFPINTYFNQGGSIKRGRFAYIRQ